MESPIRAEVFPGMLFGFFLMVSSRSGYDI